MHHVSVTARSVRLVLELQHDDQVGDDLAEDDEDHSAVDGEEAHH